MTHFENVYKLNSIATNQAYHGIRQKKKKKTQSTKTFFIPGLSVYLVSFE